VATQPGRVGPERIAVSADSDDAAPDFTNLELPDRAVQDAAAGLALPERLAFRDLADLPHCVFDPRHFQLRENTESPISGVGSLMISRIPVDKTLENN